MMPSHNNNTAVLIIDEDPKTRRRLKEALGDLNSKVITTNTIAKALETSEQTYFDLVFLSWDLPEADDFPIRFLDMFPDTLIVAGSLHPNAQDIVKAMRLGAFSFISKDCDNDQIFDTLQEVKEYRNLQRDTTEAKARLPLKYDVDNIIGQSSPMQEVFRLIHKVAHTDATVLILGESGTGKELVTRAIHHHSERNLFPMVPVNCGAIPEELLESELFGHEKGSFTGATKSRPGRFELAEGGTVFLDEIGDMSPMLQVKLLRVLQEHQFERIGGARTINADIRVIAATHQDLAKGVKEGRFREDLYYRLNVVPIEVPPLRERRSDIPLLCKHFLKRLGAQKGLETKKLHPEVLECLMRYDWPGNVRELENLLERMVILAEGPSIIMEDLPKHVAGDRAKPRHPKSQGMLHSLEVPEDGLDFNAAVDAFERRLILQALERTGGIKNQAAALLKLNRTTLVEKIKKKGLAFVGPQGTS